MKLVYLDLFFFLSVFEIYLIGTVQVKKWSHSTLIIMYYEPSAVLSHFKYALELKFASRQSLNLSIEAACAKLLSVIGVQMYKIESNEMKVHKITWKKKDKRLFGLKKKSQINQVIFCVDNNNFK